MKDTVTLHLWKIAATDKARGFRTTAVERLDSRTIWIPTSQIHHISTTNAATGECTVEVEAWWAKKKGLSL